MKKSLKSITLSCLALTMLAACSSVSDMFADEEPPLPGDRISVLELQQSLEPDDALLESQGLITPPEWQNEFWPQSGGYPNHSMQNLALNPGNLNRAWRVDIGEGSSDRIPLTAQPIVVDGTVYTVDTENTLAAFSTENGKRLWTKDISNPKEDDDVISGGIAYSSGLIFATNGYNEILALRAKNGEIYWRKSLPGPARAAPTIIDGRVFVTTIDNKLLALSARDGAPLWDYAGISEDASLVGAASPAASRDIVIPVFSSGEVTALRVENGSVAWSDNLSNLRQLGGLSTIADINALPVIDKGLVVSISFSGRLVAIDERTGTRIWQREISGAQTPWIAGNHIFLLSSDNALVALGRESGVIRWVTQLPRATGKDPIIFTGPILAGGRLIVAGTDGRIIEVDPENGKISKQWESGNTIAIPPIVADGTLYLLSENGTLSAYR